MTKEVFVGFIIMLIGLACLVLALSGLITLTVNYALSIVFENIKTINVFWDGLILSVFLLFWNAFYRALTAFSEGLGKS